MSTDGFMEGWRKGRKAKLEREAGMDAGELFERAVEMAKGFIGEEAVEAALANLDIKREDKR